MGRHATEDMVARTVMVFAGDQGMQAFAMNTNGVGPDATALYRGREVAFEFKAARTWVTDRSKPSGRRPGRFRIDPHQHPTYGTRWCYYVLVGYEGSEDDGWEVTQVRIIRSDLLPQRDTVISLSAASARAEAPR